MYPSRIAKSIRNCLIRKTFRHSGGMYDVKLFIKYEPGCGILLDLSSQTWPLTPNAGFFEDGDLAICIFEKPESKGMARLMRHYKNQQLIAKDSCNGNCIRMGFLG
jgi:hypothetical protein